MLGQHDAHLPVVFVGLDYDVQWSDLLLGS